MADALPRSNEDLDRLRGFSDCVFAVAITLVVVSFVVPTKEPADTLLLEFLSHEWPRYISFLAGFVVIGFYWLSHHRTFQIVVRADGGLQWRNLAMLFFVVLAPFTTELLANYDGLPAAYLVFSANAALIGVFNWLMLRHVVRRELVPATLSPRALQLYQWRAALMPVVFGLATLASMVSIPLTVASWCLLPVARIGLRLRLGPMPADEELAESAEEDQPDEEDPLPSARRARSVGAAGHATARDLANLQRMLSFSDNVYAFAITLLVVHLKLPKDQAVTTNDQLISYVLGLGNHPAVAYAVGFVIIGIFWNNHCRDFGIVQRADTTLLVLNLVHLLSVAVVPFGTELISRFERFGVPLVIFSLINAVVAGTLAACLWHATSHHRLVDPAWSDDDLGWWRRASVVVPAGFLAAAAVALVVSWPVWILWFAPSIGVRIAAHRRFPPTAAPVAASA
ncbi:MAG: TMEM175 family protein [Acidimicrobiales bacterium]